jgi:hypothetical protein
MDIWRIIVGAVLILIGIGWTGLRVMLGFAGDPDEGPLGGWLYLVLGLAIAIAGVFVIRG